MQMNWPDCMFVDQQLLPFLKWLKTEKMKETITSQKDWLLYKSLQAEDEIVRQIMNCAYFFFQGLIHEETVIHWPNWFVVTWPHLALVFSSLVVRGAANEKLQVFCSGFLLTGVDLWHNGFIFEWSSGNVPLLKQCSSCLASFNFMNTNVTN